MTTEALSPPGFAYRGATVRAFAGRSGPLAVVCLAILVLWYAGAVWLNAPVLIDGYERRNEAWDLGRLAGDAMAMERPILPAPHQVVVELNDTVLGRAVTSKRSLVYHSWVTLSSTRSEEHTSELQSLMRISYAVFCLK